ncbi:hypothetical protein [Peribacillus butanolivorans]
MNIAQPDTLPKMKNEDGSKISLPIYNIGLGSAKKIKIKWDLDEEYLIMLKQLDTSDDYHIQGSPKSNIKFRSFEVGSGSHLNI